MHHIGRRRTSALTAAPAAASVALAAPGSAVGSVVQDFAQSAPEAVAQPDTEIVAGYDVRPDLIEEQHRFRVFNINLGGPTAMITGVAKALLVAVLALVLTVLLLGAIGAVGPVELAASLLLAIGVFTLQLRRSRA